MNGRRGERMKLFERNDELSIMENDAAFVIPFWSSGSEEYFDYLKQAVDSIYRQTDSRFHIYIVDDCSDNPLVKKELLELEKSSDKVSVIFAPENKGPGTARNIGTRQAIKDGCAFICYLDSDDMAHERRVEVARRILAEHKEVDVVYSTFHVVDEKNEFVPKDNLVEGVKIILNDMQNRPLNGQDAWKSIVIERDNLTIPSALNVRSELASKVPFPEHVRFHEDTYTWLRYSGIGGCFFYEESIPSLYRIPQNKKGSESRERAGGIEEFNRMRCKIIMQGLESAMEYAERRGEVLEEEKDEYRVRFLLNVASMISKEGTTNVVNELIEWAGNINNETKNQFYDLYFPN